MPCIKAWRSQRACDVQQTSQSSLNLAVLRAGGGVGMGLGSSVDCDEV